MSGLEITADHHCGGEIFQSISANLAENTLKNLSPKVIGSYFESCYVVKVYNRLFTFNSK